MNLLQAVQKTAVNCDVVDKPSEIIGTADQQGDLYRIVDWCIDAWTELQSSKRTWRFMRSRFTINTVADTSEYAYGAFTDVLAGALISRFRNWFVDNPQNPPKAYRTSSGIGTQYYMRFQAWNDFQALYQMGNQNPGQPQIITVDPQNNIVVWPTPNDDYTITGDYHKSPQLLSADDDGDTEFADMPAMFHTVVMYDAMRKYGTTEGAEEVILRANTEGAALKRDLDRDQLPRFEEGSPLA